MLILFLLTSYLETQLISALKTLFANTERVEGLSKIEFKEPSSVTKKESYFIFNGKLYRQVVGAAMDSRLGLILANALFVYFEKKKKELVTKLSISL